MTQCGIHINYIFLSPLDLKRVPFLKSRLAWYHISHSSDTFYPEFFSVLNIVKKRDALVVDEGFRRKITAIKCGCGGP